MSDATDIAQRLRDSTNPTFLRSLGFHEDDVNDTQQAISRALAAPARLADIATLTQRVRANIGHFDIEQGPFDGPIASDRWGGIGVIPLLSLIAAVPDVTSFHTSRGVPSHISRKTLADIGQQAWVHRRTFGEFGLHTYKWMLTSYSGSLYWLGRLQFEIKNESDAWLLSVHIPETGPLTPEHVDASFSEAERFFPAQFGDYPITAFFCESWLLDPTLSRVLPDSSNMARFQRRWNLRDFCRSGDEDAIFFVFRKRNTVDLQVLPRATTLQRAVIDRLEAGEHWSVWAGTIPFSPATL